jgi:hypothetical protein
MTDSAILLSASVHETNAGRAVCVVSLLVNKVQASLIKSWSLPQNSSTIFISCYTHTESDTTS